MVVNCQSASRDRTVKLHRLELLARHGIADGRLIGADRASEAFIHQVLYDEVIGRIDDAAQHECRRARHDACFRKIVAEGGQADFDAGRDLLQARQDSGDDDELDIAVRRDREGRSACAGSKAC